MQLVFVDWKDGFGRLWEIFSSLYPEAFRMNKLNILVVNNMLYVALFHFILFL